MPSAFANLLGNLSAAFSNVGKTLVVDVASDWEGNIGGPEHLRSYAQRAPPDQPNAGGLRLMDMGSYYAGESAGAPRQVLNNLTLAQQLPLPMIAPAIGLVEMPGHENASCGGWPDGHQVRISKEETPFLRCHFILKMIVLPRQARDKHS